MASIRRLGRGLVMGVLVSVLSGCGGAEVPQPQVILAQLQKTYPGAPIEAVKPTPMKGLYEVTLGGKVMYADASGRYVLFGRMLDMQDAEQTQLAELDAQERSTVATADRVREMIQASERNAIKYVKGTGATSLYLFTDPKCPYCRQLEVELDKLDNVTVYKFPYPVLSLESRSIAARVWCSADRRAEWAKAIRGEPVRGPASCPTPMDTNIQAGKALGIRGTPTLLDTKGRMLVGYRSAQSIAQSLDIPGDFK